MMGLDSPGLQDVGAHQMGREVVAAGDQCESKSISEATTSRARLPDQIGRLEQGPRLVGVL